MNAEQFPYLLVMTGPGFVLMQLRSWASEEYKISEIQRLTWAVLSSVILFFCLHGLVTHLPLQLGTIESPARLLSTPASAPALFVVGLYVFGGFVGWLIGKAQLNGTVQSALTAIGLDVKRNRDVWKATFRLSRNATVHLPGNVIYRGWVRENSSGQDESRFIHLVRAKYWDAPAESWVKLDADTFLLIPEDKIERIIFVPNPPPNPGTAAKSRWKRIAFWNWR